MAKNPGAVVSTHGSLHKIKQRVVRDTERYFGRTSVPHYVVRLKQGRNRGFFPLVADLDEAVKKARLIKEHLRHGWEPTVAKFLPRGAEKISNLTVGKFLELVERHGQILPCTFHCYARKFRQVVAGIAKISCDGAEKFSGTGRPSAWRLKVDAVSLEKITPNSVERWRSQYLADRVGAARRKVEHTANAIVRNARSLFSKQVLRKLTHCESTLSLPDPLPFQGVDLLEESDADFFYISEINAPDFVARGLAELKGAQLVIFALAIGGGLRRKEIDNLTWSRVNLETGIILVAPTATARLKSDQSLGEVLLEDVFVSVLRTHAETSKGEFVLRPCRPARD